MLIRQETLQRIRSGEITLAFRCWKRPTVKSGGRLRTAIGELTIQNVEPVELPDISARQAQQAGYPSLSELQAELSRRNGQIYRIRLAWGGPDSR